MSWPSPDTLPGRADSRSDHYPSRSEGNGRQEFYRHRWSPIGRISAVIDFGGLNVGDPACDLQPAWYLFAGASRDRFRAEHQVDDASWLRGRGWALYQAICALPYYWDTNTGMVRQASHALKQLLEDSTA